MRLLVLSSSPMNRIELVPIRLAFQLLLVRIPQEWRVRVPRNSRNAHIQCALLYLGQDVHFSLNLLIHCRLHCERYEQVQFLLHLYALLHLSHHYLRPRLLRLPRRLYDDLSPHPLSDGHRSGDRSDHSMPSLAP